MRDPVEPSDIGEQFGVPVVRLDLCCQSVEAQPEAVFDEGACDLRPIGSRHGRQVSGIGAGGAVDLAEELCGGDAFVLAAQAVDEDREFLAHRRRGGRLTVGVGEHRHLGQLRGGLGESVDEGLRSRQPHLFGGALDSQRPGEVVDVFGRAAEVDELTEILGADLH